MSAGSALESAGLRAYARTAGFRRRLEEARGIIAAGLERAPDAYVACSFGKDSAALLHLVREAAPQAEARFVRWGESELLHDYARVMEAWAARWPELRLRVLDLDRGHVDERVPGRWQRLQGLAPAGGYFVGLRADESAARRITLGVHGALYRTAARIWRISPLARWMTQDVAAYNVLHDLPRLSAYDVEGWGTRTTARVPRAAHGIRHNSLAALRTRDPERFALLVRKFPEVATYV